MKINRVLIISVFAGMIVFFSCRKKDLVEETLNVSKSVTVTEKFFTIPVTTNPLVKTIAQSILKKNEKAKFVEDLVKRIGYPRWDKAMIASSSGVRIESISDSSTLLYVPFAIPDSNTTAAVLAVGLSPADTIYNLLYPQSYQQYGFDTLAPGWDARNVFHLFSEFEYSLFNRTNFIITDGRIFGLTENDTFQVTRAQSTQLRTETTMVTVCISFLPVYYRSSINIEVVGNFDGSDFCTNFWVQDGGSGPGPLGNGGGGGNAPPIGVPWWELPPCPAQPRGGVTSDDVSYCLLGWMPVPPNTTTNSQGYFFTKLDTLQNLVNTNPYFLVGSPCDFLNQFYWIGNFQVPLIVNNRIDSINQAYVNSNGPNVYQNFLETPFYVRDLNSAYGTVINCDYFPIRITSLPTVNGVLWTPQQLFDFFRRNINQFINTGIADFQPYYDTYFLNDSTKWFSSNPLGSLLHLDMINDGTVVVSDYWSTVDSSRFIVSTLRSPLDGIHPVSGNRTWGIGPDHANPGGYIFYTSAVDRITNPFFDLFNDIGELTPITSGFEAADNLWRSLQDGMINFIQANNGSAARYVAVPEVTFRPPWFVMREFLRGNLTLQQLKEAIGCP